MPIATARLAVLLAACGSLACKSDPAPADAGPRPDGAPEVAPDGRRDGPGDALPQPPLVDFAMTGCPGLDPVRPQCRGPAPLTVTFVPVFTGEVERFSWEFGDLTRSMETSPTHTYTLPGVYDVSVSAGAGSPSRKRPEVVVVTANPLGDACDLQNQCAAGLTCACGAAAQCPSAFPRGFCTQGCTGGPCPESAVCADLAFNLPGGPPATDAWRVPSCLRRCTADRDCPAGRRCRLVPLTGTPTRWERACFYGFPGDLGAACRSPAGVAQNAQCLSGLCADLGALGSCASDCTNAACPTGTACAAFNDGRRLCLRPCSSQAACGEDPLLACVPPGARGPLGWTAVEAGPGTTFCAPKPCSEDTQCAPAGVCAGAPGAAHCVLAPGP